MTLTFLRIDVSSQLSLLFSGKNMCDDDDDIANENVHIMNKLVSSETRLFFGRI